MAIAPLDEMTIAEIKEYAENLENENRILRARTDNSRKLTPGEVARIRLLWDTRNWTQAELAEAFCVNAGTISRIVNRVYHKSVA